MSSPATSSTITNSLSASLLDDHLLNQVLSEFAPHEHTAARQLTEKCLDYAVINQALSLLETEADRLEFIKMYCHEPNTPVEAVAPPSVLEWMEQKLPDSRPLLQQTADRTLLNLLQTVKGSAS